MLDDVRGDHQVEGPILYGARVFPNDPAVRLETTSAGSFESLLTSIERMNFLNAIEGTPLAGCNHLNPRYCLKVLAMFRLVCPDREIRIAAGREIHLGSLQPLGLYPANSLFVGDYLTTQGQAPEADYKMIEEMGFEVTRDEEVAACS